MATLVAGDRLGPYEVAGVLGVGGMGEVYRATDTRLDRTVAVKVLTAHLADSPEQRERFEREARAIAALNHPNICALYDLGRERPPSAGSPMDFLVMEHLDGETVAQRLQNGPLPVADALRIAVEIAEALDAAHRQGIVHRDLKPSNVMLTETGVRLLDFGLAKPHEAGLADTQSSAKTRTALTMDGSILGTLHYMSPEQLAGKPADARSDIFSFGATVYEMLTGRRPFDGDNPANVIGAILRDTPAPLRGTNGSIPSRLDRLVRTCLAKDPDARWQTTRDLKRELRWMCTGESDEPAQAPAADPAATGRSPVTGWRFAVSLLATAAVVAGAAWTLRPVDDGPPLPVHRFTIDLAPEQSFTGSLAVSPDGRHLVYGVADAGGTRLHARALDAYEATPIPGTEGATAPVAFSPDGQRLAFQLRDGELWSLHQVSIEGGNRFRILEGEGALYPQARWLPDDTIVYSVLAEAGGSGLLQVPATGGTPRALTRLDEQRGDYAHVLPIAVPGRDDLVFTIAQGRPQDRDRVRSPTWENLRDGKAAVYSPTSGEVRVILEPAFGLGYLDTNHLLYVDDGSLLLIGVDPDTATTTGAPTPLFLPTRGATVGGTALSGSGTLAYIGTFRAAAAGDAPSSRIYVAVNWFEYLKTLRQLD
ncbi:MAG: serine/threonine-protein kinase [Acidobacteriota bacterium]|nr:serine/threonine-protein kinase [Acidobacteriota bacterium]